MTVVIQMWINSGRLLNSVIVRLFFGHIFIHHTHYYQQRSSDAKMARRTIGNFSGRPLANYKLCAMRFSRQKNDAENRLNTDLTDREIMLNAIRSLQSSQRRIFLSFLKTWVDWRRHWVISHAMSLDRVENTIHFRTTDVQENLANFKKSCQFLIFLNTIGQ